MKNQLQILLFFILIVDPFFGTTQELYKAQGVTIDFFSSAPIEDIHAISKDGISALNINTGKISFQAKIRSFQFRKAKMQEHFNENFLESHKYPTTTFNGKIKESVDFSKNGEFPITIVGDLDIHGIKLTREISAILKTNNDTISLRSQFKVACKDHDIKIPKLLWKNIAEIVLVKVTANYTKL